MSKIRIARNLSLPLETVTQTIAILARKRSGKSYTARRITEQMFHAELQVVCLDPKGDWWGMRSSADGKRPGLAIVILGGEHGDVPLEVGGGELVAKLVAEERVSALIDLSLFRKHEVSTFVTAFAENLYRLKAREIYRTPVMLMIDEADAVAPQKPQGGEERMLGAIEDIVRRGGQRGIGCTLVTQRSAVLNKNVLTQAQVLVAMRTIAPQDLAAMDAWIDVHGTAEQRATLMESLPSLPQGDAWIWSPGWPTDEGIFQRVHVDRIETFDSGATPKPGERRIEPKKRADVDLEALRRQMSETVERARASDPKLLRQRISELERELAKKPAPVSMPKERTKRVEIPILKDSQVKRLEGLADRVFTAGQLFAKCSTDLSEALRRRSQLPAPVEVLAPPPRQPASPPAAEDDGKLPPAALRVLEAAASLPQPVSRKRIATVAGYRPKGGGFNNIICMLRAKGLLSGRGASLAVTDQGRGLVNPEVLRQKSGAELQAIWQSKLPPSHWRVLEVFLQVYPNPLSKSEAAARVQPHPYDPAGGGFNNILCSLRAAALIEGSGGAMRASHSFFSE